MRIAIVIVSDVYSSKGFSGELPTEFMDAVRAQGHQIVVQREILPDKNELGALFKIMSDQDEADVIFTFGCAGFASSDIVPETTLKICEKRCPGISEAMRESIGLTNPLALLSRAEAGIRAKTIIVNMICLEEGLQNCLKWLIPALESGVRELRNGNGF